MSALGGAGFGWPVRAHQERMWRIGVLTGSVQTG
jgi:hypothetical protein